MALALDCSGVSASFGVVVPDSPKVHVQCSLDLSLTFELYRYRASKWSSLRSVGFLPLKPVLNLRMFVREPSWEYSANLVGS